MISLVLDHISATKGTVTGAVYGKQSFDRENRKALERWSENLPHLLVRISRRHVRPRLAIGLSRELKNLALWSRCGLDDDIPQFRFFLITAAFARGRRYWFMLKSDASVKPPA